MESLGSYIRSAARATFSAYRSVPIRWRLAGGSAALTFVILAGFAAIVGVLTTRQVRGQFNDEVRVRRRSAQQRAQPQARVRSAVTRSTATQTVRLSDYASAEHAQIRIFDDHGRAALHAEPGQDQGREDAAAPALFSDAPPEDDRQVHRARLPGRGPRARAPSRAVDLTLLYARPLSDVDHTLARVRFFLILGVLGGTILALLAGLATAQRAMRPIVELTDAAREIERTRDPSRRIPHPEADDEVAELARTLEGMLGALDAARADTEAMLDRQREFVADASHELRTPLTSVLANLELLAEELEGEQAETAQAALRSTRRMRRLVGDLLLLARADAKRDPAAPRGGPRRGADRGRRRARTGGRRPRARGRSQPRDRLRRARRAAPPGAEPDRERDPPHAAGHARARSHQHRGRIRRCWSSRTTDPGIPPELQRRMFERFVRGGGDGGRGSGLGLAIVRAVAESHGGTVALEHPKTSPAHRNAVRDPDPAGTAAGAGQRQRQRRRRGSAAEAQTSTTTGSTIGRRRSRS